MIVADEILENFRMDRETFMRHMEEGRRNSALASLGIDYTELYPDRVVMTMPVRPITHQPAGILHEVLRFY